MKSSRHGGSLTGFLATLVVGGLLGAGVCYYALRIAPERGGKATTVERPATAPSSPEGGPARDDYIARRLREWHLTPDELKRDLSSAGDIVREKGRDLGNKIAGATADVRIIAKIKAKYTLDEELPALKIIVGCKEGHVTLSGVVPSADLIGRAIVLALDTDGVVDVVSSIKVDTTPKPV